MRIISFGAIGASSRPNNLWIKPKAGVLVRIGKINLIFYHLAKVVQLTSGGFQRGASAPLDGVIIDDRVNFPTFTGVGYVKSMLFFECLSV